jgi:hypothetical protein
MIPRLTILVLAFIFLSMQMKVLQTHTTTNFKIRYDKNIPTKHIQEIGTSLETKYSHYRKIFNISFDNRVEVFVFNTVGRFKAESQSRIYGDGDYRSGTLYLVYPANQEGKLNLDDVISRIVVHAVLTKIPACPTWLAEAYSIYTGDNLLTFGEPARFNISSFNDLGEDYNRVVDKKDVKELYAKLAYTIHFLIHRYGDAKVLTMLRNFKNGRTVEEVFESSFNENISDIEKAWVKELRTPLKE